MTNKNRIIILSILLCLLTKVFADNFDQCPWPAQGGDNEPPRSKETQPYLAAYGSIPELRSHDPNEVIGPEGYDSVRWVSINDVLNYTILFENDPELATAAAQRVDIRFVFTSKAWMRGFGIGEYSFSNMSFPVSKPSNAYQQRINLKDTLGYYVDLIAGLDVAHQQGFWTFTTIDPETGYAPWQAEMGMLPVNDSTHVGEGAVTFQLKPFEGLKTGDTISIQASIVFDQNDTIPTNRWCNMIDAGMPTSKLAAEPHPTLPDNYNLRFSGKDDENGSGIRHILLYLAGNNGIYEEMDTCAVDSVLVFPVEKGRQYKLYSIAVDNAGNREPAKSEPDVILNFNTAPYDIMLSDSTFQDDLETGGFVGRLSTMDADDSSTFTYAMAEGDDAIHNDLFQITGDLLQIRESFMCADDSVFRVRISTTDDGGLSFSKAFVLHLDHVLEKPKADTLQATICDRDVFIFHGMEYDKAGIYTYHKGNELSCDSVFVLELTVLPSPEIPTVTIEGTCTLVSSAAKGNQWYRGDGTPVEGAVEQSFTPEEDGVYYVAVTNGSCTAVSSQSYLVRMTDSMDLDRDLAEGWNWISTNLSDARYQSAEGFLSTVLDDVVLMEGPDGVFVNDGGSSSLTLVSPQESYKLKMDKDVVGHWSGMAYRTDNTPIALHKGWNWIGYVPVGGNVLSEALSCLEPAENDVIKKLDDFAVFHGGRWMGTLTGMHPGEGYMYYSADDKQFTYPSTRVFVVDHAGQSDVPAPWRYDKHAFRDNQTVIAELYVDDVKALDGAFTVGAFVGEECRGVGRYVDGLLYLTIHGTIGSLEQVTFEAQENASLKEYAIVEKMVFDGSQTGSVNQPYQLHTSFSMDMEFVQIDLNIYPNPVRDMMYINGDIDQILDIKILAADGNIMFSSNHYSDEGLNVSSLLAGVYVVAIHTPSGYIYKKIFKVNNI